MAHDQVTEIKSQPDIEAFLGRAHRVVKCGIILFHNKDGVPDLLKKLALWMQDDFSFAS